MTQNGLTPENIVEKGEGLAFPDSAVSYFSGMMGQPAGGFPKDLQRVVLKGKEPITCRPGELLPPVDFEEKKREMLAFDPDPSWRAVLSYCLYPKTQRSTVTRRSTAISCGWAAMCSSTAWRWARPTRSTSPTARPWSSSTWAWARWTRRACAPSASSSTASAGTCRCPDEEAQKSIVKVPMVDPEDKSQVGSSIPGAVSKIAVKVGDAVEKNQTLATIEAMKMETAITARMSGTVAEILVKEGETVKGGQLLLVIK